MNRRSIIKNIGAGFVGLTTLPAWANNWKMEDFSATFSENTSIIAHLVDTIIPETSSPGGKSIGANLFVERMLKDCFSTNIQTNFNTTINNLKASAVTNYGKPIESLNSTDVITLLKNSEDKSSISLLKSLTVKAYTNSEYYLTKHKNYQMAPAFFNGCVDV